MATPSSGNSRMYRRDRRIAGSVKSCAATHHELQVDAHNPTAIVDVERQRLEEGLRRRGPEATVAELLPSPCQPFHFLRTSAACGSSVDRCASTHSVRRSSQYRRSSAEAWLPRPDRERGQ